jgi:outer membrane protein TolC
MALANASVGIATAALYPKIDLAGFIGFQNLKITDFTPIGKSWSTASTVTLPLFNWGKLQANIAEKDLHYQAAFLAYQSTVLTAFQEVENALVTLNHQQQRQHSLLQAVASSEEALHLTQKRYTSGLTPFMDVLQAQQTLYQVQIQQLESVSAVAQSTVALYKALGGGYAQMPAE